MAKVLDINFIIDIKIDLKQLFKLPILKST